MDKTKTKIGIQLHPSKCLSLLRLFASPMSPTSLAENRLVRHLSFEFVDSNRGFTSRSLFVSGSIHFQPSQSFKMRHEVPNFGMVSTPLFLLDWWRNLTSDDQINEWKERAAKSSEKLEYLEYNLLELEGKLRKRVTDCQNAEENEEGQLARAYLLLGLCELGDLYKESRRSNLGPNRLDLLAFS